MKDSVKIEVSPHSFSIFHNICQVTKSGVFRMAALFTGEDNKNLDVFRARIALESDVPIVLQLLRSHMLHIVIDYFVSHKSSHTEPKLETESNDILYGFVDGVYRHAALLLLM